jgi:hypothetical protein
MSKFDVKVNKADDGITLAIDGIIDEDANFSNYALNDAKKITMNLLNVKSINSCGIREWVKWIETAGSAPLIYQQCPKVIVDQINMVQGFLPKTGSVESFFVPYYNEDSGSEKNVLFSKGKEFSESGITAPVIKDDSGNEMEMDVIETKYFKFLKK